MSTFGGINTSFNIPSPFPNVGFEQGMQLGSQANFPGTGSDMIFPALAGAGAAGLFKAALPIAGINAVGGILQQGQRSRGIQDAFGIQQRAQQDNLVAGIGANFLNNQNLFELNKKAEMARLNLQRSGLYEDSARRQFGRTAALQGMDPARSAVLAGLYGGF